MGRTYKADAIVLRSLRFGEADRVLHLYTAERGRVNAIAKGVRKTTSRFGARLEPLTRAQLLLHEGRGELHTVSGADIVASHAASASSRTRWRSPRSASEAVLKLFPEPDPHPRVFEGLVRFLDLLDRRHRRRPRPGARRRRPWLSAEAPGARRLPPAPRLVRGLRLGWPLVGYSAAAGGAVCGPCAPRTGRSG